MSKTRHSMENWAKIFRKVCPKTCSKNVWILLGTLLGNFGILKTFFLKIFENSTFHGTLGINFFQKNHPITRLDTFGNTFGQFWNFENIFSKIFEDSTFHRTLGKKKFRKVCPKTCSKHVWILLGTILGVFGILNFFLIFLKIF